MVIRPWGLLIAATMVLLTACSNSSSELPYDVDIDSSGVGRIDRNTPFEAAKVNALLPGFEVSSYTAFEKGHPHPLLRVTRHGHEVMIILPDKKQQYVRSVQVFHPGITLFKTIRINKPIAPHIDPEIPCMETEEGFSCRSSHTPAILFHTDSAKKRIHSITWSADADH